MKLLKRFFVGSLFFSITAFCLAQNFPTITPNNVSSYVNQTVTVTGTVIRSGRASHNEYFLRFSIGTEGFAIIIPGEKYKDMLSAGIDINAIEGKKVSATGQIVKDPKYGIQMHLADPVNQLLLPEDATEIKYTKGIVSIDEAPKYVGQYATIQGKVLSVDVSKARTTYMLRLTTQKNGFSVIIFPAVAGAFEKAKIDIESFAGKTVQVYGNIKYYEQYGYEIILDKKEDFKLIKQ